MISFKPLIELPLNKPRPLNWGQEFKRQAPLEVEIGFGDGEFLMPTGAGDLCPRGVRFIETEGAGDLRADSDCRVPIVPCALPCSSVDFLLELLMKIII